MVDQPTFSFEAIGTSWAVTLREPVRSQVQGELLREIQQCIEAFDKAYSRFRADSAIVPLAHGAPSAELPPTITTLFTLYKQLYELTGGLFTPCIGQTLHDLGYDAEYSLLPKKQQMEPPPPFEVVSLEGTTLHTTQPVLLDFGAAGKGYLVDLVAALVQARGITQFTVDGSGDIAHQAAQPLRVGLEHPTNPEHVLGVATLNNCSICASAGNRRAWGGRHHIINPRTLASPERVSATWVVASTTMGADALSTCLFLVEPKILQDAFEFEYLVVYTDLSYQKSAAFPAEMFYSE
jgi:thiamine biosynthesis lipoprotein